MREAHNLPVFEFKSKADKRGRIVSMIVGVASSALVFMSGVDYEALARRHEKDGNDGAAQLRIWAAIHLVVVLLMSHHAFYLLVSGPGREMLFMTTIRKRCQCFNFAVLKVQSCTKGYGRYFGIFIVVREMLETAVQLQGINNTARENDLNALQLRSAILCLNMIMLPVSAGLAYMMRGPTAAKVCAVILESIFDNLFIAVGVALQLEVSQQKQPHRQAQWRQMHTLQQGECLEQRNKLLRISFFFDVNKFKVFLISKTFLISLFFDIKQIFKQF